MRANFNLAMAGQRLTQAFVRPPVRRETKGWALTAGLVAVIGVFDYYSGIEISLAIFYLVPISLATAWFGAAAGVGVSVGCTVVRLVSDTMIVHGHPLPLHSYWNASASLLIAFFVVWLLHALLTLHRRLEGVVVERTSQLRESVAARQKLEREILDVSERERTAFGRELHDELGQHFVATALAAQVLAQTLGEEPAAKQARAIAGWIETGIAKTRKLARGLLLAQIEPQRLAQELEELASSASQGGVPCRAVCRGTPVTATAGDCAQLFRIAQEAVTNALRHAHARAIDIMLVSDDQALCLIVEDNGCGVAARPGAREGIGLRIMEHRARIIGAFFSLVSTPEEGTKVICRLPQPNTVSP